MFLTQSSQATGQATVPSAIGSIPALRGRGAECERLDRLIADARAGTSGVLVVRGEPGVGKSALIDYLAAHAAGCRIARAAGVEPEMELSFAGLHQLCAPFLDHLPHLPTPQRDAMETAFGERPGDSPDRFLIGLAVLSLLSEVAATEPLVCLVDDAHWFDSASMQILGFVARRLAAESVVIVFGLRDPADDPGLSGLPELTVEPLHEQDARELLVSAIPGRLDDSVRDRIVAEAAGNPLALLELPRSWTPAAFAGGFGLPDGVSVSGRIEDRFRARLTRLPDASRRLMLVAAAEPAGDAALIWAAAERLAIPPDAAAPATDVGLLEADGQGLRFRHPRIRSVVYREAPLDDRRRVHRALAEATDPTGDADRRVWHLAAAATGPDEDVASALERSAGQAQARAGFAAAAAFLQRAVALTTDRARRSKRALAAVQASLRAGSLEAAAALLATAEAGAPDELERVRVDAMRGQLAFIASRGNEAVPLLLATARRLESIDRILAHETYLDAFSAALFGARLNHTVGVADVAAAARGRPRPDEPTSADLVLDALVALADGYEGAIPRCRDALHGLMSDGSSPEERLRWSWQAGVIALELWDDEAAFFLSRGGVETARGAGTLADLQLALSAHVPLLVFRGELSAAASGVAETRSIEEATGIRSAPYGALVLAAWQGRIGTARELIDQTLREARARNEGIGLAVSEYSRAVLCNGSGQYAEALDAAVSASEHREVAVENWGLSELVEPATRTGRIDLAKDALDRLATKADATGTSWAVGIAARSRALLSEGDRSERLFRNAIEHLSRTHVRAELARTRLLYGEHLRRMNRRIDARRELNTAYESFSAMGMDGFADRARHELLATGERVRRRSDETRDRLTPQEEQIARLAGDGHSNSEISARLFLSPRTVEWHLRKVFDKLGISSRKQLPKR